MLHAFYKFLKKRHRVVVRFRLMTVVGKKLLPQYRFSWPYLDWWNDAPFNAYLKRFNKLGNFNTDRR